MTTVCVLGVEKEVQYEIRFSAVNNEHGLKFLYFCFVVLLYF